MVPLHPLAHHQTPQTPSLPIVVVAITKQNLCGLHVTTKQKPMAHLRSLNPFPSPSIVSIQWSISLFYVYPV